MPTLATAIKQERRGAASGRKLRWLSGYGFGVHPPPPAWAPIAIPVGPAQAPFPIAVPPWL